MRQLCGELSDLLREANQKAAPVPMDSAGGVDFAEAVAGHERKLICEALRMSGGLQKEAARLLHLNQSTLTTKIHVLGIDAAQYRIKKLKG